MRGGPLVGLQLIVYREPVAVEVLVACRDAIVHAQVVRARPKGERRVAMRYAVRDQAGEPDRLERALGMRAHALEGVEQVLPGDPIASLDHEGVAPPGYVKIQLLIPTDPRPGTPGLLIALGGPRLPLGGEGVAFSKAILAIQPLYDLGFGLGRMPPKAPRAPASSGPPARSPPIPP
eukprot:1215899-Pyramimonas_sp.AAC.1